MIRLFISVEGKSERMFVEQTLVPHLLNFDVFVELHDMKGNISVDRISEKLNRLIHNYDFITTLYDFYGFKGLESNETKKTLEEKIKESIKSIQRHKIIPYIQMYEFEALLFSDAEIMANNLNVSQSWIDEIINTCQDLETINNSKETAPSKRIGKNAKYIKTQHAPEILQEIGLLKIREKCQGFNKWITQLEKLEKLGE
jgi:predicted transcriptional regulator